MTVLLTLLVVYLVSMQWVQMRRDRDWRAEVRGRLRQIDQRLAAALQERVNLQELVRQRVAERVQEFREGGGRQLLRERRAARLAAQQGQAK